MSRDWWFIAPGVAEAFAKAMVSQNEVVAEFEKLTREAAPCDYAMVLECFAEFVAADCTYEREASGIVAEAIMRVMHE